MQSLPSRRPINSTRTVILIALGSCGLLGIGLIGLWWSLAMRVPAVTIPTPAMPNPNAFDFYRRAGEAIRNSKQVADAYDTKTKVSYSLAQREALVRANRGVIDTMHQGFAYSYRNPPARSFDTLFPYYAKFRGMARLLSVQAEVQKERGEWKEAVDSGLDAERLGADIPYGSCMIGDLVGIACQAIGRRGLWNTIDHLNAAQTHAAIIRLTDILDRQLPYADTLQEEKWAMQAALLEIFRDSKKMKALAAEGMGDASGTAVEQKLSPLFYLTYSKSLIMRNYTRYMDAMVDQARQPYGLHLPPPHEPTDPINRIMIPVFAQARLKDVENRTQNGLLLLTLALHAFQLEYGRYPTTLAELTPLYLKKLPDDPFAAQGGFKYFVKGQSYVLYSVGPDGKDDGGMPIDDPKHTANPDSTNPDARYFVTQNSVGDVVAGKNRQ